MAIHCLVLLLEAGLEFSPLWILHGECRILSSIPQAGDAAADHDLVGRHAFGFDCACCLPREISHPGREGGLHGAQRLKHLPLGKALQQSVTNAQCAEQTCIRGNNDGADPQARCHPAGVLRSRAPKGYQRIFGRIIPFAKGDPADRVRHALVGDLQEPLQQALMAWIFACTVQQGIPQCVQGSGGSLRSDGNPPAGRVQPSEQQVHVGEGEWAPRTIAGWTRVRAGTFGPYENAVRIQPTHRAATRRHRFDGERRGDQVRTRHLVLPQVLEVSIEACHVRAGAAHIEGDHALLARTATRERGTHHTSRWPAQQCILGAKSLRAHQPARAGHHVELPCT